LDGVDDGLSRWRTGFAVCVSLLGEVAAGHARSPERAKQDMTDYEAIFDAITSDARYQRNLDWGEARSGHPEGTVRAHSAELEQNVNALRPRISESDYWRLRVLVHVHDTFKADARAGAPIAAPDSHASLARAFLAGYCDDADLLAAVQYHDEPFALWRQFQSKGRINEERLTALLSKIEDWNLFLAFCIVDGCTEGKGRDALHWLFQQVAGRVETQFTEADIQ
jgi:hypothetical protein